MPERRRIEIVDATADGWAERLAGAAPANPFFTSAYAAARARLGWECRMLIDDRLRETNALCPVFIQRGRAGGRLEITSLPVLIAADSFWPALLDACRRHDIVTVDVATFASSEALIPRLPEERARRERWEYVLELHSDALWADLSSHHRRQIKRGQRSGLRIERSTDRAAVDRHVALMATSMERRKARGEAVPDTDGYAAREVLALMEAGAGEVFQAWDDDGVLSSILVLIAREGGYYHSAGTGAEGLRCGASHALVHEIAMVLKAEGKKTFNLGGVSTAGSGLEQFKGGFGARRVSLEAVQLTLRRRMTQWFGTGVRMLRDAALSGSR